MSTFDSQPPAGNEDPFQGQDLHPKFSNLLKLLKRLRENPTAVLNTTREELIAYARANLPPIWLIWAMLILVYCRSRTRAVRGIGRLVREAVVEGVRHEDEELYADGALTDICEWDYSIAEGSTVLMNRVTGESLATGDTHPYDIVYATTVVEAMESSGEHSPACERGRALFPSLVGIYGSFDLLERHGVLVSEEPGVLRLHPTLIWHQDEVDALIDDLRNYPKMRNQLAAAIGDLPHLAELTQSEEVRRLAEECQLEWRQTLSAEADQKLTADLVHALGDAGGLEPYLADALSNEATAEAAVWYVKDDPRWCDSVWTAFQSSEGCRRGCADYLIRHGYHTEEVLEALVAQEFRYSDAVKLSLSHAPQLTSSFLQKGVRSDNRNHRMTAAAVLALIDQPWSRNELISVLRESDDWSSTRDARIGLCRCSDPAMRVLVESWETEHRDSRPDYELGRGSFDDCFSRWHDAVLEARERIPSP